MLARSSLAACGFAALLVGLSILGLRSLGTWESAELDAYDWFLRLRPAKRPLDPRIVFVAITDDDIRAQGRWPLSDGVLAQTVEALERHSPRAIGLDIYRDVPVPPGSEQFHALLERDSRVVGVKKYGERISQVNFSRGKRHKE